MKMLGPASASFLSRSGGMGSLHQKGRGQDRPAQQGEGWAGAASWEADGGRAICPCAAFATLRCRGDVLPRRAAVDCAAREACLSLFELRPEPGSGSRGGHAMCREGGHRVQPPPAAARRAQWRLRPAPVPSAARSCSVRAPGTRKGPCACQRSPRPGPRSPPR